MVFKKTIQALPSLFNFSFFIGLVAGFINYSLGFGLYSIASIIEVIISILIGGFLILLMRYYLELQIKNDLKGTLNNQKNGKMPFFVEKIDQITDTFTYLGIFFVSTFHFLFFILPGIAYSFIMTLVILTISFTGPISAYHANLNTYTLPLPYKDFLDQYEQLAWTACMLIILLGWSVIWGIWARDAHISAKESLINPLNK